MYFVVFSDLFYVAYLIERCHTLLHWFRGVAMAPTPRLRAVIDHDGAVILDEDNDRMSTLNSTGAYV